MGLFDAFKSTQKIENEQEAVAALVLACVASDGEISTEEVTNIIHVANSKKMFKSVDYGKCHKKALEVLRQMKGDFTGFVNSSATLVAEKNKKGVFVMCVDLVFSDGTVRDEEEKVVTTIQKALGISDADAKAIIDVISAKNSF